MDRIQPWVTTIARVNLAEFCDLDQIAQEILTVAASDNKAIPNSATRDDPFVGGIVTLRDDYITPKVLEYLQQEYNQNLTVDDITLQTWGMNIVDGSDLEPHIHGLTNVTTVFYPYASGSRLVLMDPRMNAARGFPKTIRDSNFGNYRIDPKPGDLWIFPSYVAHSVTSVKNEFRLSLVNDYFLDTSLD